MKDNIYFLINQLSILTQMGAFLFLYTHVLKNRFSFFVILGIEFAVQLVIGFSCRVFNIPVEIQTVLQFMLLLFVLLFLFEDKIWKKLLIYFWQSCISIVVSLISRELVEIICGVSLSILSNGNVWGPLGTLLTSDILLAVIFLICRMILAKKNDNSNTKLAKSQIKFFLLIIVVHYGLLIVHYGKMPEIDTSDLFMEYIFQSIIHVLIYFQYFTAIRNMNLLEENYLLSLKQSDQENEKRYYDLAQAKFDEISKIRHDLNNHLGIAKQLILEDQKNEAQEIMEDICKTLDEIKVVQYCSNPLINTILTTKANEPAYKAIDMQFVMKDCDRIPCDATELCSLFSNLFDNAAKAALESGGNPVLQMESGIVNEFFVLKITNSAKEGAVSSGVYTPTTKNNSGHGYGLSIIEMIANKYGGSFVLEQVEAFVTATVMLRML